MTDGALLRLMIALASEAGRAIEAVRARGFSVQHKGDESPVTAADHAAEAVILTGLRAATAIPVISEEEFAAGPEPHAACEMFLVDPLDGTRDFAAGRDTYAVNIALIRDGAPTLGVVGAPRAGVVWSGGAAGAQRHDAAGARPIRARAPGPGGLLMLVSRSFARDADLPAMFPNEAVRAIERSGSSLKFCRLAEGAADVYPRLGRTMEWDTAAPQAVLEAAGGSVRTLDGRPLSYGKPGWDNPWFIARGLSPA